MSDVLNCDGMAAEQARAALPAHCGAQEAARKAERDKRAEHRRANAERLGIIGGQPERPAHYPARHGWQKLTHNGEPATGVLYASEWRCFETDWPYKLLTFVAVVRPHVAYAWQIQLEGEDLTKETAWLEASDIDAIAGASIRFRNGFVLESRDGIAVASTTRMTEAEIQASAVILDVVERIKADASPASSKPKTKQRQAVTQSDRTEWTLQAQEKVAAIWVAWRLNHNTKKKGGREIDCFEKHKATLPECIKTAKDFHNCRESARKHGLIPKHNRKRRKSAG